MKATRKNQELRNLLGSEVELVQGDEIIAKGILTTGQQPYLAVKNTYKRIRKIEFGRQQVIDIFGATILLS